MIDKALGGFDISALFPIGVIIKVMELSFLSKIFLKTVSNLLIILGFGVSIFTYGPLIYSELQYLAFGSSLKEVEQVNEALVKEVEENDSSGFYEEVDSFGIQDSLSAVSEDFSIVIPKIDVNAPVVEDVSMADTEEYMASLREGVAHAKGTSIPGEEGNMFLFAHSSLNFWQLGPYATVFNLLNKLEEGDIVFVVKDGKKYMYSVESYEVVPGWDTEPFYREFDDSVLTMVTCYPPGATINRYVVTANYVGVIED